MQLKHSQLIKNQLFTSFKNWINNNKLYINIGKATNIIQLKLQYINVLTFKIVNRSKINIQKLNTFKIYGIGTSLNVTHWKSVDKKLKVFRIGFESLHPLPILKAFRNPGAEPYARVLSTTQT